MVGILYSLYSPRRSTEVTKMDVEHDNVRPVEEDRLSSLPDQLIHKILSSVDMKYVVQTSLLSSREFLWKSMPCLKFSSEEFRTLSKFAKFVTHVLSHRNHVIEVSSVKLDFCGAANQAFVQKIANYAFSHNVQELTVSNKPLKRLVIYPPCLFSSPSLKHFTLTVREVRPNFITLSTPLDFPAVTTMQLNNINLCGELFSKCVNLKNLTLEGFSLKGTEELDIVAPRLSILMLNNGGYIEVINLIAPQLEHLIICDCSIDYLNAPPGLSSLCYYTDYLPQQLSKDGFHSLNKVTICLYTNNGPYTEYDEEDSWKTMNMLQQLHSAKHLTFNADIIECLSPCLDLLSHHPSSFSNLICLTVDYSCSRKSAYEVKMSSKAIINFLLENSPSAKLIMELPKAVADRKENSGGNRKRSIVELIEESSFFCSSFRDYKVL